MASVIETSIVDRIPDERADRYRVSVREYKLFRQQGFLVVPGLVSATEVAELRRHTEDLMQGRLPEQRQMTPGEVILHDGGSTVIHGLEPPPEHYTPDEKAQHYVRIHMLHRKLELHERYLLHPRVLDVLEAIIGPDVLAMQSMLFIKPPGKPGQGWHQDSFYIPSHPDSLCGAWIAIDDCDELNGAMWMAAGSNAEPIYPSKWGHGWGDKGLADIPYMSGESNPNDHENDLAKIADKYPQLLVPAKAGDVVFFGGHILHRSKQNYTTDRYRRSFVGHYCNARSFTQWGADGDPNDPHSAYLVDPITKMTNGSHILARGDTHLPFAKPKFGTPCAALLPLDQRQSQSAIASAMMGDMDNDMMGVMPADPNVEHDHADEGELAVR